QRGLFQVGPGIRSVRYQILVAPEDTEIGAPPPRIDVAVRTGDARADEGEEIVDLILAEILVYRLQHPVLDEQAELVGIDRHTVRRAAGAGLLEEARMLAADVGRKELEFHLPVGMFF